MKIKIIVLVSVFIAGCAAKPAVVPQVETPIQPVIVEAVSAFSPEYLAEGKTTFENNCARCHQLYSPNEFDKTEWKKITNRMQNKAHLDDVQIEKVYQYIVSNLK